MSSNLLEVAADVACLPLGISNVYLMGISGAPWVLIDAGVPGKARSIREAAASRFGQDVRPEAILLTHGHFDHAGSALELAKFWDVPIYAHLLEFPYLTGKSDYPPADPTAPGFMAFLSRFMPTRCFDFSGRLRPLEPGKVPGLPDWAWYHTPGHSPGHVSFFRRADATLVGGDAFATANLDSLFALATKKRAISRPPVPFTCDWQAAQASVRKLDDLNPLTFAAGHGLPMTGPDAAEQFTKLAYHFPIPSHGRYVAAPAKTTEQGVVALPPPPPDPVPGRAGALGVALLGGIMFAVAARRRTHPA